VQRLVLIRRVLRSRTWAVARAVIGVALGLAALYELNGKRGELTDASAELARLHVEWLLAAIALEFGSYVAWGQLQRRLLRAGGTTMTVPYAFGISLAAGAIANSLPGGTAFAGLYSFRFYRRSGADTKLAGWTLLATLVCTSLTLCIVAAVGVFLAFGQSSSLGLVGVVLTVLVLAVFADAIVLQRKWFYQLVIALCQLSHRMFGYPREDGEGFVDRLFARLGFVRMSWLGFFDTLVSALALWVFDCAALAVSFLAVGAGVPWRGLLLTYGASQLAVNLPVTPGGLGVVEGTITIALVAFGGAERSIVPAVLCYRIVSFWGFLPVGWAAWAVMALTGRRHDRVAVETMAELSREHAMEA
jgi:putative heme transporter